MTESDLKTLIEDTLAIPVFEGKDTIIYPGATLELTSMTPAVIGDGRACRRKQTAYINLFYNDRASLYSAAISLLGVLDASDGISAPDMDTYYDTTAKKYRAVYQFEILYLPEEEVAPVQPETDTEPEQTEP